MACSSENRSPERDDSEHDSQNSLDQTISHADELFLTDETDSPPDKNLEIKRLAEIPSPDLHPRRYMIPSIAISDYGVTGLVSASAPNLPSSSMSDVLSCQHLPPIASSSSPPSQFSVESDSFPPETINQWSSAPDVRNASLNEPILSVRSISSPPETGLGPTSEDTNFVHQRLGSSMSISPVAVSSPAITSPIIDSSSFLPADQPVRDNCSPFLPSAVSSPGNPSLSISPNAVSPVANSSTPIIAQAEISPSPDTAELLDMLSISDSSKDVENVAE